MFSNDIHLYFSYPEHISDPGLLCCYESLLSADERARMARFHFARNRHQYLVTRALIRTSLSAYYPIEPAAWQFGKNRYGKPEISYPDANLTIRFNLSHTLGLTVCAIAHHHDIGVDVEDSQRSTRASFSSLGSYFTEQEIEDLGKVSEDQQQQRFFDYWTLKESYIKARGGGLSIPLSKFSFRFQANKLMGFSVHPDLQDDAECWQFWRIPLADRYRIALAIKSKDTDFKVTAVNSVPLQGNVTAPLTFL
jgi:4'-phosphopantetheinyl transferase